MAISKTSDGPAEQGVAELPVVDVMSEKDAIALFRGDMSRQIRVVFRGRAVDAQFNMGLGKVELNVSDHPMVASWKSLDELRATVRDAVQDAGAATRDDVPHAGTVNVDFATEIAPGLADSDDPTHAPLPEEEVPLPKIDLAKLNFAALSESVLRRIEPLVIARIDQEHPMMHGIKIPDLLLIGENRYSARVREVSGSLSSEVEAPSREWVSLGEMCGRENSVAAIVTSNDVKDILYDLKKAETPKRSDGCHIVRFRGLPCRARIVGPNDDQLSIEYGEPRDFKLLETLTFDRTAYYRERNARAAGVIQRMTANIDRELVKKHGGAIMLLMYDTFGEESRKAGYFIVRTGNGCISFQIPATLEFGSDTPDVQARSFLETLLRILSGLKIKDDQGDLQRRFLNGEDIHGFESYRRYVINFTQAQELVRALTTQTRKIQPSELVDAREDDSEEITLVVEYDFEVYSDEDPYAALHDLSIAIEGVTLFKQPKKRR